MMKRFLVFSVSDMGDELSGGLGDVVYEADSIEELESWLSAGAKYLPYPAAKEPIELHSWSSNYVFDRIEGVTFDLDHRDGAWRREAS